MLKLVFVVRSKMKSNVVVKINRIDATRILSNLIASTNIIFLTIDVNTGRNLWRLFVQRKQHCACFMVESFEKMLFDFMILFYTMMRNKVPYNQYIL